MASLKMVLIVATLFVASSALGTAPEMDEAASFTDTPFEVPLDEPVDLDEQGEISNEVRVISSQPEPLSEEMNQAVLEHSSGPSDDAFYDLDI